MSLKSLHLRKLIKLMYLAGPRRTSAIRADIRDDLARERGNTGEGGGDFYGPFWRDAKDHVFGRSDLHAQTALRIASNGGRENLYTQLRDGFLLWWDRKRRWTNEPFRPAAPVRSMVRIGGIDCNIKVDNILSVRDARDDDHFVYPYWFNEPALDEESSRIALWCLTQAFPAADETELRLLDVIRGETFGFDKTPPRGDEAEVFRRKFDSLLLEWDRIRREYD